MKNVLIHLHPSKKFDREREIMARIQVDNSLELGWKIENICFITNFPWEYNSVKSLVVGDENFCDIMPRSTNTVIVPHLFNLGLIGKDETWWVHDFDACQMHPFQKTDLELDETDVGLTTYGWSSKWNLGSFFFKDGAKDIFEAIRKVVYHYQVEDERALSYLTKQGKFNNRIKELNITYNFGMRHVAHNWHHAQKPLKVLHFHPYYKEIRGFRPLRSFMYGENELLIPLMDTRLMKLFQEHGIK